MNDEKIKELEAMLVHLSIRIEKLEKNKYIKPHSSHLKELKAGAAEILKKWH